MVLLLSIDSIKYDYTLPYFQEQTLWWTRRSEPLPRWAQVIYVYHTQVWTTLFLTMILTTTIWIILAKYHHQSMNRTDLIFSIYRILIQTPHPNPNKIPIRPLQVTWLWSTSIIAISFNCIFFSLLSKQSFGYEIQDIQEAIKTKDSKFIYTNFQDTTLLDWFPKQDQTSIRRRRVVCGDRDVCLQMTSQGEHIFMMGIDRVIQYMVTSNPNWANKFYAFKESIYKYPVLMFMRKGYPLLDIFDKLIQRIQEAGFLLFWENQLLFKFQLQHKPERDHVGEPLGLEHLLVAFILWAVGMGLSIMVFVLEKHIVKS